jgi:hypothetical protein
MLRSTTDDNRIVCVPTDQMLMMLPFGSARQSWRLRLKLPMPIASANIARGSRGMDEKQPS